MVEMAKLCVRCYITGLVQGVGFRYATRRQAINNEVTGWVKNLPDGRVEVLACGASGSIDKFMAWLQQGPIHAKVVTVISNQEDWQEFAEFAIIG
jgi:acylphosphatase